MKDRYYGLLIDGKPVLVPDNDLAVELNDLDHSDSGRDEMGFMHRVVLRHNVKSMSIKYSTLNLEEYRYMESLFYQKTDFSVAYRDLEGKTQTFRAYRSKHSIVIHDAASGIVKNYSFKIIEC